MTLMCVERTCASSTMCVVKPYTSAHKPVGYAMHQHLRAWRESRKLTQEQVGNILGVRHTTIGRWEKGEMKLSTSDLERLAVIYRATTTQLLAPPGAAELVDKLDRAQKVIEALDPDALDHWLALGAALAKKATTIAQE